MATTEADARVVSIVGELPQILPRPGARFWDPATPVHEDEAGCWHVFSYEHVGNVLLDSETFSYDLYSRFQAPGFAGMWAADPPRHTDLRALAARRFSPYALRRFEPAISEVAEETIGRIECCGGRLDIMHDLAAPIGRETMQRLIGFRVDPDLFGAALQQQRGHARPENYSGIDEFVRDVQDRFAHLRRARAGDGLVRDLLDAQAAGYRVAGEPLTDWDLAGFVWMLLVSASDGAGVALTLLLSEEHGLLDELRADPELIPGALDEALRWWPEFPGLRVRTRRPARFGDVNVPEGAFVTAWFTAANRDPARFEAPDHFDPRRPPHRHVSFGHGIHHCLGAAFVRLQARVVIDRVLRRFPGLTRDRSQPVRLLFSVATHLEAAPFSHYAQATTRTAVAAAPEAV